MIYISAPQLRTLFNYQEALSNPSLHMQEMYDGPETEQLLEHHEFHLAHPVVPARRGPCRYRKKGTSES